MRDWASFVLRVFVTDSGGEYIIFIVVVEPTLNVVEIDASFDVSGERGYLVQLKIRVVAEEEPVLKERRLESGRIELFPQSDSNISATVATRTSTALSWQRGAIASSRK